MARFADGVSLDALWDAETLTISCKPQVSFIATVLEGQNQVPTALPMFYAFQHARVSRMTGALGWTLKYGPTTCCFAAAPTAAANHSSGGRTCLVLLHCRPHIVQRWFDSRACLLDTRHAVAVVRLLLGEPIQLSDVKATALQVCAKRGSQRDKWGGE